MKKRLVLFYGGLAAIVVVSLAVALGHETLWPDVVLERWGVHAAMEAWGTVYSLLMALFLWQRWRREWDGRDFMVASGFFGMCVMDFAAAISSSAVEMGFFHAMSGLSGGVWFSLAYLPLMRRWIPARRNASWLMVVLYGIWVVGLVLLGRLYTPFYGWSGCATVLSVLNYVAAGLLFAGVLGFSIDYHRSGGIEAMLLACLALLLGMAHLTELGAETWHDEWWIWHGMKVAAFAFVLLFVILSYRQMLKDLRGTVEKQELAEQALRESERRYRLIAEHSADVIWTTSMDLEYEYVSPAVKRMRGYTPEEVLAMDMAETVTPESLDAAMEVFAEEIALEQEGQADPARTRTMELELKCKDGSTLWSESTFSFLRDAEGRPTGLVGVTRDISARKEREEQHKRHEAEIEQAQRLEGIGRLAGGIAHDFNNLLSVILNYADFAAADLDPADPRVSDLKQIKLAGKRAAELTEQLLAFSRKETVNPRVIELGEVVKEVERLLRRTIGEDIDFKTVCDPGAWAVKADPGRIQQVILNLASNARDAMPDGGKLTITVSNETLGEEMGKDRTGFRPGRYACITVSDTGCGMGEDVVKRAIEPFFTTKAKGKGTGLGLSTVYGIVKQAGGEVFIDSELDRGTAVKVCLPATDEQLSRDRRPSLPPTTEGEGKTILLVEDEPSVIRLIRRMLEKGGYRVLEARDGLEAVRVAKKNGGAIDLLLTDVVMPRMSGHEAAERITREHPGIKVLFMSGYADEKLGTGGMMDEGTSFIQKPFTAGGLLGKVMEVLAR